MNAREKRLAYGVGALVAVFAVFMVVRQVLIKPLRAAAKQADLLEEQLRTYKKERRAFFVAEDSLREFGKRTFADEVDLASARSGELITRLIGESGLREADFSRLPFGPTIPRGARELGWELGWNIQGGGELGKVVDLLFLLQSSPQLHRLENVVVSAGGAPGQVKVRLRYLTLLIKAAPEGERVAGEEWITLSGPERGLYNGIVSRDLLSPYIPPAPPPPATPPAVPTAPPGPSAPPPPSLDTFRVVSLSEWDGQPEVHIHDMGAQRTRAYKPGDELAGGIIVAVDYRPWPKPGQELLVSHSRVILKMADEFWAVERGQTLAQKYKLKAEQLP